MAETLCYVQSRLLIFLQVTRGKERFDLKLVKMSSVLSFDEASNLY